MTYVKTVPSPVPARSGIVKSKPKPEGNILAFSQFS